MQCGMKIMPLDRTINRIWKFFIAVFSYSMQAPGRFLRAPRISSHSAHEDGKVVSPTHRLPLPPRRYPWYSFLLQAESQTPG